MDYNINELYNNFYKKEENNNTLTQCQLCDKEETIILDKINSTIVCENCGWTKHVLFNDLDQDSFETTTTNEINFFSRKSSFRTNIKGNKNNLLIKIQSWNTCYKEDTLNKDFKQYDEVGKAGKIKPNLRDIAKIEYKKMSESKHLKGNNEGKQIIYRGKPRKQIKFGYLFDATKHSEDSIRTPKEIAKLYGDNYTASDVNKGCNKILKYKLENNISTYIPSSKPIQFIKTKCKKINMEKKYVDIAIRISDNNELIGICCGPQTPSIAAACILLVCKEYDLPYTKKDISEIFDIKIVTIDNVYKKLYEKKKFLLMDTNKIKEIIKKN